MRIGVCIPKSPAVFWKPVYRGIRDRAAAYEKSGVPIWLMMRYEPLTPEPVKNDLFTGWLGEKQPKGLILFPKGRAAFLRDIVSRFHTTLIGVRNADLFDLCSYVGTDPDVEGRLAAQLMLRRMPNIQNVAIIRPNYRYYDYTTTGRRWGFCDYLIREKIAVEIQDIFIDFQSKVSAAMIARSLTAQYADLPLDCIYSTAEGNVGEVCQGISKALRANWPEGKNPFLHTCCIGHEYPKSAQQYIDAGLLAGCLIQDAYQCGYQALEQTVELCLGHKQTRSWNFIPPTTQWYL